MGAADHPGALALPGVQLADCPLPRLSPTSFGGAALALSATETAENHIDRRDRRTGRDKRRHR
jgi:hypothetical protein